MRVFGRSQWRKSSGIGVRRVRNWARTLPQLHSLDATIQCMNRRSRLGTIFAIAYLAVFLLAQCFTVAAMKLNPANSEMSGIFGVLVTLPWSLMLVPIWNALGYIEWYGRFANSPGLYGLLGTVAILGRVRRGTDAGEFSW